MLVRVGVLVDGGPVLLRPTQLSAERLSEDLRDTC